MAVPLYGSRRNVDHQGTIAAVSRSRWSPVEERLLVFNAKLLVAERAGDEQPVHPVSCRSTIAPRTEHHVLDQYLGELAWPMPWGHRMSIVLVKWSDWSERHIAAGPAAAGGAHPRLAVRRVTNHGKPPELMRHSRASSQAGAPDPFWDSWRGSVQGELVIGVPARESGSSPGSRSRRGNREGEARGRTGCY